MQIDYRNWIEAYEIDGNILWGIMVKYPILFKYNMVKCKMELVSIFPEKLWKDKECGRLFGDVYKYHEYLYFIPVHADCMIKYDIGKNKYFYITIEEIYKTDKYFDFYKSIKENSVITMYSSAYKALVHIDCESDKVIYDTNFIDKLREGMDNSDIMYFKTWNRQENHGLFMSSHKIKIFRNEKVEILEEGENDPDTRLHIAILVDDVIYAVMSVDKCCKLMKYDIAQKEKKYFNVQEISEPYFTTAIYNDNYLLFLPSNQGEKIIRFHLLDELIDYDTLDERKEKHYAFANMKKITKVFSIY